MILTRETPSKPGSAHAPYTLVDCVCVLCLMFSVYFCQNFMKFAKIFAMCLLPECSTINHPLLVFIIHSYNYAQ